MNSNHTPNLFFNQLEKIISNGAEELKIVKNELVTKEGKVKQWTQIDTLLIQFQYNNNFSPTEVILDNLNLDDGMGESNFDAYHIRIIQNEGILYTEFSLFKKSKFYND